MRAFVRCKWLCVVSLSGTPRFLTKLVMLCACLGLVPKALEAFPVNYSLIGRFATPPVSCPPAPAVCDPLNLAGNGFTMTAAIDSTAPGPPYAATLSITAGSPSGNYVLPVSVTFTSGSPGTILIQDLPSLTTTINLPPGLQNSYPYPFATETMAASSKLTYTMSGNATTVGVASGTATASTTAPTISASRTTIPLTARAGGQPVSAPLTVSSSGAAEPFTLTSDSAWLSASPLSGTTGTTVMVTADPSLLAIGSFTGHLTLNSTGGPVSTATITVNFTTTLTDFQFFSLPAIDGGGPQYVTPVQGLDGNFYGTASAAGLYTWGTVFKFSTAGAITALYSFCPQTPCTDGSSPFAGLLQATDGNLYGTTETGGSLKGVGTIFQITPMGTLNTIYRFCSQPNCPDGAQPFSGLIQATDGNFYGTTLFGGSPSSGGTVFKITPAGALTPLYSFCASGSCTDGEGPYAGLVQATNGYFYGTTYQGGANARGTVFRITSAGGLTTLHSFNVNDGAAPYATLIQATDGNLYGTTVSGGANGTGGTIFRITPAGALATIYNFCAQANCADGSSPYGGLVQAADGNFYGTTYGGGANGWGTVFRITPAGVLTTLHNFDLTNGGLPLGGLAQGTDGNFYGTTPVGGSGGIFKLSVGLGPFVKTLPTSGRVGTAVKVMGTNLSGATSVTFRGRAASFTVVSDSEISTTVPSGAITGKLQVTTPGGTLSSSGPFRVMPVISSFSPTSGPVGTVVTITGRTLTGATSVTFGGVKATSFTVDSYTQITATVPTSAKTGRISVTTPGGTALSVGTFTVN